MIRSHEPSRASAASGPACSGRHRRGAGRARPWAAISRVSDIRRRTRSGSRGWRMARPAPDRPPAPALSACARRQAAGDRAEESAAPLPSDDVDRSSGRAARDLPSPMPGVRRHSRLCWRARHLRLPAAQDGFRPGPRGRRRGRDSDPCRGACGATTGIGCGSGPAAPPACPEMGAGTMFLEVGDDNRAAQALYARLGFAQVGPAQGLLPRAGRE